MFANSSSSSFSPVQSLKLQYKQSLSNVLQVIEKYKVTNDNDPRSSLFSLQTDKKVLFQQDIIPALQIHAKFSNEVLFPMAYMEDIGLMIEKCLDCGLVIQIGLPTILSWLMTETTSFHVTASREFHFSDFHINYDQHMDKKADDIDLDYLDMDEESKKGPFADIKNTFYRRLIMLICIPLSRNFDKSLAIMRRVFSLSFVRDALATPSELSTSIIKCVLEYRTGKYPYIRSTYPKYSYTGRSVFSGIFSRSTDTWGDNHIQDFEYKLNWLLSNQSPCKMPFYTGIHSSSSSSSSTIPIASDSTLIKRVNTSANMRKMIGCLCLLGNKDILATFVERIVQDGQSKYLLSLMSGMFAHEKKIERVTINETASRFDCMVFIMERMTEERNMQFYWPTSPSKLLHMMRSKAEARDQASIIDTTPSKNSWRWLEVMERFIQLLRFPCTEIESRQLWRQEVALLKQSVQRFNRILLSNDCNLQKWSLCTNILHDIISKEVLSENRNIKSENENENGLSSIGGDALFTNPRNVSNGSKSDDSEFYIHPSPSSSNGSSNTNNFQMGSSSMTIPMAGSLRPVSLFDMEQYEKSQRNFKNIYKSAQEISIARLTGDGSGAPASSSSSLSPHLQFGRGPYHEKRSRNTASDNYANLQDQLNRMQVKSQSLNAINHNNTLPLPSKLRRTE